MEKTRRPGMSVNFNRFVLRNSPEAPDSNTHHDESLRSQKKCFLVSWVPITERSISN